MQQPNAWNAVERAAQDSYSRLIAFLAARSRDISAAEDALADAFLAALETWPSSGVPDKPEAWLLVSARRKLIDAARHKQMRDCTLMSLLDVAEEAYEVAGMEATFPDERLKLLFVCAHPAIDVSVRTPLMLQTVLAMDAACIASAFIVKPATMGQRLTRTKAKIRDARIPFDIPEVKELPERLGAVLETIYATYNAGWDDMTGADTGSKGFAAEAILLGRLLLRLMPDEPEVQGLLALMLYCEARRDARRNDAGDYVPLSRQDPKRWLWPMLTEAHQLLLSAEKANRIGHFQLEAAIQSAHTRRAITGKTDWEEIALLYEGLIRLAPTTGALVGRAAAVAEARGASVGWALLENIPVESVRAYQPYWALAAHLLASLERDEAARVAYERAIGLCENHAMRNFLTRKMADLNR